MPLSYQNPNSSEVYFIHPTPFVNITKNFAKSGSGEILGVTYSITLEGTLMAGMGSPYISFNDLTGEMRAVFSQRAGSLDTGDKGDDRITWGKLEGREYRAIQAKQKLLMNLFSKRNEGGLLHIIPPDHQGFNGMIIYPRIVSVDFPSHDPGNPNISQYTIQLEADTIWGPAETALHLHWRDYDSFINGQRHATVNEVAWMISDAQESWDIQETESRTIRRSDNPEKGAGDGTPSALVNKDADGNVIDFETGFSSGTFGDVLEESIFKTHKVYQMTRTVSAVGKGQFASEAVTPAAASEYYTDIGRGDKPTTATPVLFWKAYNPNRTYNREAWQQARGFVYDTLRYGDWFLKGMNQIEGNTTSFGPGFGSGLMTLDNDDLDKGGINLDGLGIDAFKGFNYTRGQQVDKLGGSFTVTESWVVAPADSIALETMEMSVNESGDSPIIEVSINGTIEGLVDNASWIDSYGNRQDMYWNYEADDDVDYNLGATGDHTDAPETTNPGNQTTIALAPTFQSKYQAAEARFNFYQRTLYQTVQSSVNRLGRYSVKINPKPTSVSNSLSPLTGVITYGFSFNNGPETYLPFALSEDISVNDTMPGEVYGSHLVLGRTRGPVFQNINTQTQWERRLSISCIVDTISELVFDDRQHDDISIVGSANPNQVEGLNKTRIGDTNLWGEEQLAGELRVPRFSEKVHPVTGEKYKVGYLDAMKEKPSNSIGQKTSLMRVVNMFRPIPGIDGVTKVFMNSPTESWNPRTGAYTLDISWVYEIEEPYTQATNGGVPPVGGAGVWPAAAPTQTNNPTWFNTTNGISSPTVPLRYPFGNVIDANNTRVDTP